MLETLEHVFIVVFVVAIASVFVYSAVTLRRRRRPVMAFLDRLAIAPEDFSAATDEEVVSRYEFYTTVRRTYFKKPGNVSGVDGTRLATIDAAMDRLEARRAALKGSSGPTRP